jgi:nucleotide-binding universal stress UspA family protein
MLKHFLIVLSTARLADDALAHTAGIAHASRAHITLLRLLDQPAGKSRFVDPVDWHIRKMEAEASLNEMGQNLRKTGLKIQTTILEGGNPDQVLQYAQAQDVDLMILAGQPEGISNLFHGLMKSTRIPLLVLRADGKMAESPACYRKILVPLDGSQRAEYALPLAGQFAQICDAQIVLAHVIHKPEMPRRAPPPAEDTELVERLIETNRSEAERYLEQTAARLPVEVETRLLVNDSVPAALHQLAEQEAADLIVLSAHGHSGAPQWPYGSVANNLITYSDKPVLVVQDLPVSETTQQQVVARSGKGR